MSLPMQTSERGYLPQWPASRMLAMMPVVTATNRKSPLSLRTQR